MPEFFMEKSAEGQDYGFDAADIEETYQKTLKSPKDNNIRRKYFSKTTGSKFEEKYNLTKINQIKINKEEKLVSFSFNGTTYVC